LCLSFTNRYKYFLIKREFHPFRREFIDKWQIKTKVKIIILLMDFLIFIWNILTDLVNPCDYSLNCVFEILEPLWHFPHMHALSSWSNSLLHSIMPNPLSWIFNIAPRFQEDLVLKVRVRVTLSKWTWIRMLECWCPRICVVRKSSTLKIFGRPFYVGPLSKDFFFTERNIYSTIKGRLSTNNLRHRVRDAAHPWSGT